MVGGCAAERVVGYNSVELALQSIARRVEAMHRYQVRPADGRCRPMSRDTVASQIASVKRGTHRQWT